MAILRDTLALITGGSSGIGRCVAEAYAAEGARVLICARGLEAAEEAVRSIRSAGGDALAFRCDVTDDESVAQLHAEVRDKVGRVNVLVNSAGVYRISKFLETPLEVYRQAMEVNYLGAVRMIQTLVPDMVDSGYGRIVNIASTAGKYGSMYQAHYNGSKHALVGITRSLALEFAQTGVSINAICPGFVDTPMLDKGMEEFAQAAGVGMDEARKRWLSRIPMGRFLDPEEINPLAVYLGSRECRGMTGQAMTISCGMVLV